MKERVEHLVGKRARIMWVSTFHSACVRILRKEIDKLGYKSSFSIYDAADQKRLMTNVAKELDLDPKRFQPGSLLHWVSDHKNELRDAADATEAAKNKLEEQYAAAYTLYAKRLRQANALDFDDLIMLTVHLFQQFPDVREVYRRRFRHVLVDEYQDTNHAQYALISELCAPALRGGRRGVVERRADRAGRADGRRRRRPVDLRLPRRQHPQHPRLRAGLPQRDLDPAGAELPLDPDHPHRRQRGDRQQQGPQGQEALVRRRRRRADRRLRRRRRVRRGALRLQRDRQAHRRGPQARRRRGLLPHQRAVPRLRGSLHPHRPALPRGRRRALLRAPRDPRRPRLPPAAGQRRRRGLPRPDPQRPQARHRRHLGRRRPRLRRQPRG